MGYAIGRFNDLTIGPCEAIRHFILASHHEPCTRAPSHFKESPAHGAVNQTIAAIPDHPGCFDPRIRCAGRIDSVSAIEWKSRGNHLGPRSRALSQEKMAGTLKSSRHA